MLKNDFDWGPLSTSDIHTIKREIENENVYNKYRAINNGDIVMDIGASVGPFTCSILDKNPYSIYCVEPSNTLISILQNNILKYTTDSQNIKLINSAISTGNDPNVFCSNKDNIKCQTFSSLINENYIERIDFLKIDCEGGEYDIFVNENLEFLQTKVSYIAAEFHLTYPGNRDKFIFFRDHILNKFRSVKIESCTKQTISYGQAIDLSQYIYDNNFIATYNHTIMVYIENIYNILELLALSPEHPNLNYIIAEQYFNMGHTASALTHFLRAAERTDNNNFAYKCLIMCFKCLDKQQNRDFSSTHLLKQAIAIKPHRPEAYFYLSKLYEYKKQWYESYTYSSIGLECTESDNSIYFDDYPGKIGLIFNKAIAAYWWDKIDESRELLNLILEQYNNIPEKYLASIEYNLTEIEKKRQIHKTYTQDKYSNLKFVFNASNTIDKNYSQAYQDLFCLIAHNGKPHGSYLEIGAGDPLLGNNTYLLENKYNWKGISVEINQSLVDKFKTIRTNNIICADATRLNYQKLLEEYEFNENVDYLQIDCEPPAKTFEVLLSIPFNRYKFGVITYEHDYYLDITKSYRDKSRNYLWSLGYKLILPNISLDDTTPFEDWWVHPMLIDQNIIDNLTIKDDTKIYNIEKYLFTN